MEAISDYAVMRRMTDALESDVQGIPLRSVLDAIVLLLFTGVIAIKGISLCVKCVRWLGKSTAVPEEKKADVSVLVNYEAQAHSTQNTSPSPLHDYEWSAAGRAAVESLLADGVRFDTVEHSLICTMMKVRFAFAPGGPEVHAAMIGEHGGPCVSLASVLQPEEWAEFCKLCETRRTEVVEKQRVEMNRRIGLDMRKAIVDHANKTLRENLEQEIRRLENGKSTSKVAK